MSDAMNGQAFLAYIEHVSPLPSGRRDTVVVDNVSFHKVAGVKEAIKASGAELRYLPQYSPDLNPIESVFHPEGAATQSGGAHSQRVGAMRSLLHSRTQTFRVHRPYQARRL